MMKDIVFADETALEEIERYPIAKMPDQKDFRELLLNVVEMAIEDGVVYYHPVLEEFVDLLCREENPFAVLETMQEEPAALPYEYQQWFYKEGRETDAIDFMTKYGLSPMSSTYGIREYTTAERFFTVFSEQFSESFKLAVGIDCCDINRELMSFKAFGFEEDKDVYSVFSCRVLGGYVVPCPMSTISDLARNVSASDFNKYGQIYEAAINGIVSLPFGLDMERIDYDILADVPISYLNFEEEVGHPRCLVIKDDKVEFLDKEQLKALLRDTEDVKIAPSYPDAQKLLEVEETSKKEKKEGQEVASKSVNKSALRP